MPRNSIYLAVSVCLVSVPWAGCRGVPPATDLATPAENPAAVVFIDHRIDDPEFDAGPAATIRIPEGWEVVGGLSRNANSAAMPVWFDVDVRAPGASTSAGRAARFYPALSFEFDPQNPAEPYTPTPNGNLYSPPPEEGVGAWLLSLAEANPRPGVTDLRLVADEPMPEATAELRDHFAEFVRSMEHYNATMRETGYRTEIDLETRRVVVAYREDGRAIEETFLLHYQCYTTHVEGRLFHAMWGVSNMQSKRGPAGDDLCRDETLSAVLASWRAGPAWEGQMQHYWDVLHRERARHQMRQPIMPDGETREVRTQRRIAEERKVREIITRGWTRLAGLTPPPLPLHPRY